MSTSAAMSLDTARLQMSWAVTAQFGDQVPLFFYSRLFVSTRDCGTCSR
jgi:hypothetical protein